MEQINLMELEDINGGGVTWRDVAVAGGGLLGGTFGGALGGAVGGLAGAALYDALT